MPWPNVRLSGWKKPRVPSGQRAVAEDVEQRGLHVAARDSPAARRRAARGRAGRTAPACTSTSCPIAPVRFEIRRRSPPAARHRPLRCRADRSRRTPRSSRRSSASVALAPWSVWKGARAGVGVRSWSAARSAKRRALSAASVGVVVGDHRAPEHGCGTRAARTSSPLRPARGRCRRPRRADCAARASPALPVTCRKTIVVIVSAPTWPAGPLPTR